MTTETITIQDVTAQPWCFDSRQWRMVHGIHIPWIAELSPFQVGSMGKQQRARYDKERAAVWQASGDGCRAWSDAVIAAFDAGRFEQYGFGVSDEANTAVFGVLRERASAALKERERSLWKQNHDMTGVKVRDVVYCLMSSQYGVVAKLSAKSARVLNTGGGYGSGQTWKHSLTGLQWLSHGDLTEQAKAGADTITKKSP